MTTKVQMAEQESTSLLFGVTESDIAALPDGEFDEVWAALGKVARARARAASDLGAVSLDRLPTRGRSVLGIGQEDAIEGGE